MPMWMEMQITKRRFYGYIYKPLKPGTKENQERDQAQCKTPHGTAVPTYNTPHS